MRNNSFILTEEERKRIKKLHEATTSSASGSYNQPMAFTEPVELDIETTFIDGDNIQDDSEEINLDIEDIAQFLEVTEEDDNERMRKLHKENSTIKEQVVTPPTISEECLACATKALKGERDMSKVANILGDAAETAADIFGVDISEWIPGDDIPEVTVGSFDYTADAAEILAMMGDLMVGGTPTAEDFKKLIKLGIKAKLVDLPFIYDNLNTLKCNDDYGLEYTAIELCWSEVEGQM